MTSENSQTTTTARIPLANPSSRLQNVSAPRHCHVCGSHELEFDAVEQAGVLLLLECARCESRWTVRVEQTAPPGDQLWHRNQAEPVEPTELSELGSIERAA